MVVKSPPLTAIREPDYYREVSARSAGVAGLLVTADPWKEGQWRLTQKVSGRSLGSFRYPSIAAARRAAQRVALLADWSDPELVYDMSKPSERRRVEKVKEALRPESQRDASETLSVEPAFLVGKS
jgi:hypothetical protein